MVESSVVDLIISWFPDLSKNYFKVTSPWDEDYNCIAWAADEDDRWWWPNDTTYWPDNVPQEETIDAFISAYQTLGYEVCDNDRLETGFNKVAIYVYDDGRPSHAARQLEAGTWTSKIGKVGYRTHARRINRAKIWACRTNLNKKNEIIHMYKLGAQHHWNQNDTNLTPRALMTLIGNDGGPFIS